MNTNTMKIHYGQEVKKRLKEHGMSKAEFARRIHYSRNNIYNIFSRSSIDIQLLKKIGDALDFDFIKNL